MESMYIAFIMFDDEMDMPHHVNIAIGVTFTSVEKEINKWLKVHEGATLSDAKWKQMGNAWSKDIEYETIDREFNTVETKNYSAWIEEVKFVG